MKSTDDLILFYHLARLGSFSKTAEHVDLTKSVISKRISRMEQEMGVQLIFRTTRRLTLSEAGEVLLKHAIEVYHAVQNTMDAMHGLGEKLTGTIRITVPTVSGELVVPEAIAAFNQKFPDVHIEMDLNNQFVDIVEEGFDLAIRTGYLQNSSYIARRLVDSQWIICAAPSYLKHHGTPETPKQLQQHNCLAYTYQETGANDWLFRGPERDYTVKVSGNFSTNAAGALRSAALLGQGLAYVPRVLVDRDLKQGTLVEVLPKQVAKRLGIYAVYPFTRHQPVKVNLFIEQLYQVYQQHKVQF